MEFLALMLVTGLIVRGYSETIQCYECDNCGKLDDSLLQSCPPDLVTSTTPSTPITDEPMTSSPATETTPEVSTTETTTTLDEMDAVVQPVVSRTSRQVDYESVMKRRSARDSPSYHCYSLELVEGSSRKTKKGCVTVPGNKTACEVLTGLHDVATIDCRICSENKCNGSAVLKYSFLVLAITLVMDLLY